MRNLFLAALAVGALISCSKDDDNQKSTTITANYFPLDTGNYWVYQHYVIDTLGNETPIQTNDSLFITGDTILDGEKHFIVKSVGYNLTLRRGDEYMRDSSGYLVTNKGEILFSANNFTDVLLDSVSFYPSRDSSRKDTFFTLSFKMEKPAPTLINAPVGSFNSLNYQGTSVFYFVNVPKGVKRFRNNYYANGVGKVLETYHFGQVTNTTYERRLVRYHVK